MVTAWKYAYETDFTIGANDLVPFEKKHNITDRLLLNKSFSRISFQPDNCTNFLEVKNQTLDMERCTIDLKDFSDELIVKFNAKFEGIMDR